MQTAEIGRKSLTRLATAATALGLMFFLSADTLLYWQAWVILIEFIFISVCVFFYFVKRDPTVLERRIKFQESEPVQKWITTGALPFVVAAFPLPGLDKRFGWSDVPLLVEIASLWVANC
jgi:archaellum biogenesis protein FlaJ (TadC family)